MKFIIDHIKKYYEVYLIVVPSWFLISKISSSLLFLVLPLSVLYLGLRQKHIQVVLIFATLVMLADHPGFSMPVLFELRMFVILCMALLSINQIRLGKYQVNQLILHLLPFLMVVFLCYIVSPEPNTALTKGFSFFLLYFVGFHYINYIVKEKGDEIIKAIAIHAILVLSIGLLLIFLKSSMVYYGTTRFNGLFRNPNGLGLFLSMMAPFMHYYFKKVQPPRITKISIVLLFATGLILCSSRNALLASIIYFILANGIEARAQMRLLIFGGVLPIVLFLIQAISVERIIINLGLEKYLRLAELESGSGRTHAWAFAVSEIEINPVIGMGFGYEEYLFHYKMPYYLWKTGHQGGVHNSYLAILLDVGFVGLILFFYFLGNVIVRIRDRIFMIPVIFMFFMTAIFESWMVASLNAFHIYFVIMLVFMVARENNPEPVTE